MNTQPEELTRRGDARVRGEGVSPRAEEGRPRTLRLLMPVPFLLSCGLDLMAGEWLTAAFYLAAGFFLFKGRDIERWPKAARAVAVLAFAALCVAAFVRLIQRAKGLG